MSRPSTRARADTFGASVARGRPEPKGLHDLHGLGPHELWAVASDRVDMVGSFDPENGTPVPVTIWIRKQSLWAQAWLGPYEFLTAFAEPESVARDQAFAIGSVRP